MLRVALYSLGAIVLAVAIITIVGFLLPQEHVATRDAVVAAPPDAVFRIVTDVGRYPEWRPDVSRVELLGAAPLRWREHAGGDVLTYEATVDKPPMVFVARIADTDLQFGGTWTYELKPEGAGTRVTITERGEVYNPIFRFMSRFVLSQTATMEKYLAALTVRAAGQMPAP